MALQDKYINPFTDYGFKRLFGTEMNKDLLIDFLNQVLPERHHIQDLSYTSTEQLGATEIDRKAIFDLYCTSPQGERFIVEIQKAKQNFFKDRSVYYSTFPIQEQAKKGDWDYQLAAVYTIGILDFVFDDDRYYLQNRPAALQERIFQRLFEAAEIARFDPTEKARYEESLKYYRDLKNVVDTSYEEGKAEGKVEGKAEEKIEVIIKAHEAGIDAETISRITAKSIEEVEKIIKERER